jgi:hypothetical protein
MLCKQYGVDDGAVVTPGTFTDDAQKIGGQAGVQLVDGEKLRTIVVSETAKHGGLHVRFVRDEKLSAEP